MAIVQISLIQLRRGLKNTTGLPQLASGELGWAIDTQQLYIGNGGLAEGAPAIGNTEILTQYSELLSITEYTYESSDTSISHQVSRNVQHKLDDFVTTNDFGAIPVFNVESPIDSTTELQNAINTLFANSSIVFPIGAVELLIPAGTYYISRPLTIPPYCNLRGAGLDNTVIIQTGAYPVFVTTDALGNTLSSLTATIKNIKLSGITFNNSSINQSVGVLNAIEECVFDDIKFTGSWQLSNAIGSDSSISLTGINSILTSKNNLFKNCYFGNSSIGIYSLYDISTNTFDNCTINTCGYGVYFNKAGF